MTPERTAALVRRWVGLYTRDLPAPVAERRAGEIDADLHDHIAHERANGVAEPRIALGIASRLVRGLAADAAWRSRHAKEETMKTNRTLYRSAARIAVGVGLVLTVPLVATLLSEDEAWSPGDFVLAAVLLTIVGVAIELALKRAGNLAVAAGIGVLGILAGVLGEADDAPGLVLLGILLLASGLAIGVRRAQQSG